MPRGIKKQKSAIEEIKDEIGKYDNLETLTKTAGGKDLIAYLENNFVSSIDELISKYKSTEEIKPLIAEIDITLRLLRMITKASANKEMALEALKDEEKRELEL